MGAAALGTGDAVSGTKGISEGDSGADSMTSDIPERCCEGRLVKAGGRATREVERGGKSGAGGSVVVVVAAAGGGGSRGETTGAVGVGFGEGGFGAVPAVVF